MYQQWSWDLFSHIANKTRTQFGFSGVKNVDQADGGEKDNNQESFFFAETLKYLYLLYAPQDTVEWSRFVFNTEAHPLKRFTTDSAAHPQ
jgi:hypothetical protein